MTVRTRLTLSIAVAAAAALALTGCVAGEGSAVSGDQEPVSAEGFSTDTLNIDFAT